jgi:CubicO group peptidase (beta-lactamase class C family)
MLQTSQRLASGENTGYGLGWDLEPASLAGEATQSLGHEGEFFLGGSTSFLTFPGRGIVVAVMTNTAVADTGVSCAENRRRFRGTAEDARLMVPRWA